MTDDDKSLALLEFAASEYARRGWQMPALHVRILDWLERTADDPLRVLKVFRGAGKSTLLAVCCAWRLHRDPLHQMLVQSADDALATDLARDVLAICEQHPLLAGSIKGQPAAHSWWTQVGYARNARVPQLRARGVLSRTTGSRADEIINDDCEVEKNVETAEARKKLRRKLGEQTHILKPRGRRTLVGTPHAIDSLYDEAIRAGAEHLTIPLFAHQQRFEDARQTRYAIGGAVGPDGVWLFVGIGPHARLLVEGRDYAVAGEYVEMTEAPGAVLDVCTGNAWPERFDRRELQKRRRECRTLNEWDSQYQLQAKPIDSMRLDPVLLIPYDVEPEIRHANNATAMLLGQAQIVSATLRLDPSSGKPKSDVSALCLILADAKGRLYWHRAIGLLGELANVDQNGAIRGGQVEQICDVIERFQLPRIEVETNGVGTHVPAILRGALRRRGLQCGVAERASTMNKQKRILAGLEPPLRSGYLWAHVSVLAIVEDQMRDWNPAFTDQADDYLDCAAGAILAEPVRIGQLVAPPKESLRQFGDWRPGGGVCEVEMDFSGGYLAEHYDQDFARGCSLRPDSTSE